MFQSVIRDPGGNSIVRIHPDVCNSRFSVVNGSLLIVSAGTTAFVVINGNVSPPYSPGRYTLSTGVDPFFVRFRNIMTRGDAGISISVFFVSTDKSHLMTLGTGEIPFHEIRFKTTMKALAPFNLTFSISNAQKFLSKMVGTYNSVFTDEDIERYIHQIALLPVREAVSKELSRIAANEFNSHLSTISNGVKATVSSKLDAFGIRLLSINVTAVNIPDTELQRLNSLEQKYAEGKIRTDVEVDNLQRVWANNIGNRTISEMMTGISSRPAVDSSGQPPAVNQNSMTPMMLQMMMMSQILPTFREPLASMTNHTDLFGGSAADTRSTTSTADSPPPMPERQFRCPSCNGSLRRNICVCPICGYRF